MNEIRKQGLWISQETPPAGDSSNSGLWMSVGLAAALAFAAVVAIRRKNTAH